MSTAYRTATARLPAETEPIGPPGRPLPRRLWMAIVFDEAHWWPAMTAPFVLMALAAESAPSLALVALVTFVASGLVLYRRRRLLRLLTRGVVAPATLVERREKRFASVVQTRARMLPGWKRNIASYEGPTLRNVVRVGLAAGPFADLKRDGGEWDEDLCLFDPARPSDHVFVADLPAFVGMERGRGWVYVEPASAPSGSALEIALGIAGLIFCGLLGAVSFAVAIAIA